MAQTPAPPPAAAPAANPALDARIAELPALLRGEGNYDQYFAAGFRAQVSKEQFDALSRQFLASYGALKSVSRTRARSPWLAEIRIDYANGSGAATIEVDPATPHLVTGLRITGLTGNEESIETVAERLAGLHGVTGFALAKLGSGAPELIASRQPDRPFAIGSAFKLVILAELVRATNSGERTWDDLVTLDGSQLPGGGYFLKPKGTTVTLRELATQMISVSDNSATDILLHTLGREKIEAMLPLVGVKDPARNRPFLGTLEAFKLKGIAANDLAGRYLAADEAGRRSMLAGEVAGLPALLIRPTLFRDGKPVRIEELEWFLSPADLVRIMDWLRRNSECPRGAELRTVLSKNPGIAPPVAGKWQWVGYKGGSEPGVMNMTLLLQAKGGDWYAATASWNDPARALEEPRFIALVSRLAELAAP
ncbi:serine hydrolase [Sphingomonas sp. HF-S4]|uniref:Serine hydrolase n=1 Tax=Sphingomonas agrestis TaxID=3080540 RepID=A0ABU3Y270_9SPHN|nr:serine hydrolase [Sphingomonas sp. HF-S4]MDV3455465.1 serine hydrolase [Sphingomonas sp. HF-S4]